MDIVRVSSWAIAVGASFFLSSATGLSQPLWPQFRGPGGQGIAADADPPVTFAPGTNVLWQAETPAGQSSPCIWGTHIFLSGVSDGKLSVFALDRNKGRELWRQTVSASKLEHHHESSGPANSTPTADAERVYVYFGSFGVVAYTHAGEKAWEHPIPTPKNHYGTATSPVLYGQALILVQDADEGGSKLLALDRATGKTLWEKERPMFTSSWSTPLLVTNGPTAELLVLGSSQFAAYDAASGEKRWWVDGFPQETVAIPSYGDGLIYVSSAALGGRGNQKMDVAFAWKDLLQYDRNKDGKLQLEEVPEDYKFVLRPELPKNHPGYAFPVPFKSILTNFDANHDGALSEDELTQGIKPFEAMSAPVLMAIQPGGEGDVTKSKVVWKLQRGIPEVPSPLFYQSALYLVRDGGLLTCVDAKDGSVRYQDRLGTSGHYRSSPVAAAGRIYVASESGTVYVLQAGAPALKILAKNDIGEPIAATPAILERTLILRTREHVFAFGK